MADTKIPDSCLDKIAINSTLKPPENIDKPGTHDINKHWQRSLDLSHNIYNHKNSPFQLQWSRETVPKHYDGCFIHAVLHAYNNHLDLVLNPDDIWMLICLNFTKYVNKNSKALRHHFVAHADKIKLKVTDNHFDGQECWDLFFAQMTDEIKKNTKNNIVDTLTAGFSTTTPITSILSSACIMNILKQYFEYGRSVPCCGLRHVLFMGKVDDWLLIKRKLQVLGAIGEFGSFGSYASKVSAIIDKFVDTICGKTDVEWWNKIINKKSGRLGSGSTAYISGWINHFYYGVGDKVELNELILDHLNIPVEVDDRRDISKSGTVYVIGGFNGFAEYLDQAIRPAMSMAVFADLRTRKNA